MEIERDLTPRLRKAARSVVPQRVSVGVETRENRGVRRERERRRRHRLEKVDPTAAVSEAVEPIVYYLDPGVPEPVRGALLRVVRDTDDALLASGISDPRGEALVLVPGLGHTVNGSTRWVRLGFTNFQMVEAVKLMVILYIAGYLARKAENVQTRFFDTLKPLGVAGLLSAILLVLWLLGVVAVAG